MHEHEERVIVITGATSGFGKGAALRFAEEGADLVLAGRRKSLLKEVAELCEDRGAETIVVETDVSDFEDVKRVAQQAIRHFGRIDVWVNNAGASTFGRYDEIPVREHEKVISTNLLGTMYGAHLALAQFRKQGYGTLINIGSYLSKGSAPYQPSYVASKHGVRGLGRAIRQELAANGDADIHVCTIMPTSMDTPFFQHAANHMGHPVVPIPPVYNPEQVIDAIVRVASKPEEEIVVGRQAKVAAIAGGLMPLAVDKMMAKKTHNALMEQEESAPDSTGNLFKPVSNESGIHGGWLQDDKQKPIGNRIGVVGKMKWIAALAMAAPFALAALGRRRTAVNAEEHGIRSVA